MLRNGGTAHWEIRGQIADSARPVDQACQNGAAGRIAESVELGFVSLH